MNLLKKIFLFSALLPILCNMKNTHASEQAYAYASYAPDFASEDESLLENIVTQGYRANINNPSNFGLQNGHQFLHLRRSLGVDKFNEIVQDQETQKDIAATSSKQKTVSQLNSTQDNLKLKEEKLLKELGAVRAKQKEIQEQHTKCLVAQIEALKLPDNDGSFASNSKLTQVFNNAKSESK